MYNKKNAATFFQALAEHTCFTAHETSPAMKYNKIYARESGQ